MSWLGSAPGSAFRVPFGSAPGRAARAERNSGNSALIRRRGALRLRRCVVCVLIRPIDPVVGDALAGDRADSEGNALFRGADFFKGRCFRAVADPFGIAPGLADGGVGEENRSGDAPQGDGFGKPFRKSAGKSRWPASRAFRGRSATHRAGRPCGGVAGARSVRSALRRGFRGRPDPADDGLDEWIKQGIRASRIESFRLFPRKQITACCRRRGRRRSVCRPTAWRSSGRPSFPSWSNMSPKCVGVHLEEDGEHAGDDRGLQFGVGVALELL